MIKIKNFLIYHLIYNILDLLLYLLPNNKISNKIRGFIFKPFFKRAGKNLQLAKGITINMIRNIEVGDNVYIAHNCWINGTGGLILHNDVIISPNCIIATTKHKYIDGRISNELSEVEPIEILDGVWIAGNSTISLGVKIGKGAIVGANSVVTKDVNSYTFVGGTPAMNIRKLR